MTQEEKAKAYNEALERAKKCLDENRDTCFVRPDVIFPELADKDEKIRKEIIDFICWATDRGSITKEQREKSNYWLAWLEKQGGQKPAWSEDDKRILDALITSLINERFAGRLEFLKGIKVSLVIDWLKSLKDKIKQETV